MRSIIDVKALCRECKKEVILPMKAAHELTGSSSSAVFKIIERHYAIHMDGVRSPMPIITGGKTGAKLKV